MTDYPPNKTVNVYAASLADGRIFLLHRLFLSLVSVLLVWLAFPGKEGEGISWLAWVCLVPWGLALTGASPRMGLLFGFVYGFFAFFGIIPGLMLGLRNLLHVSPLVQWLAFAAVCASAAIPYALFGYLQGVFDWLGKPWGAPRAAAGLCLPLLLVPQFLPGNHAHVLYNTPVMIQVVDLGGIPLLLFLVTLANWYLVDAIKAWARRQTPLIPVAAFVLLLAATGVYGTFRLDTLHQPPPEVARPPQVHIVSIQPNVPTPFRGNSEEVLRKILQLSKRTRETFPEAELLVWPENPLAFECDRELVQKDLKDQARKTSTSFLIQCRQNLGKFLTYTFSTALLVNSASETNEEYHKIILFPFGEYLPYSDTLPFLKKLFRFYRQYSPGRTYQVMNLGKMKVIPSICYESTFSSHTRRFVDNGGNLIVNLTNDGWWGRSDLSMVHLALSVFRTVEYRVPMVRVTNSGAGAYVKATGEIVPGSVTPLFEEAVTYFPLTIPEQRSPYFRLGDWFLGMLAVVFCLDLLRKLRKK